MHKKSIQNMSKLESAGPQRNCISQERPDWHMLNLLPLLFLSFPLFLGKLLLPHFYFLSFCLKPKICARKRRCVRAMRPQSQ